MLLWCSGISCHNTEIVGALGVSPMQGVSVCCDILDMLLYCSLREQLAGRNIQVINNRLVA